MKIFLKVLATLSLIFLLTNCTKDKTEGDELIFEGRLTSSTNCKDFSIKSTDNFTADTISKVEYIYNSATQSLQLRHINAGFNCCPVVISGQVSLNGNTIIVQEEEEAADCHCNCLYDLEFQISGLAQKTYTISFVEPYIGSMNKIEFDINLIENTEGSFSVIRRTYPWGLSIVD